MSVWLISPLRLIHRTSSEHVHIIHLASASPLFYPSTQSYPPCSTSYYTPGHEVSQIGSQNNLSIMQLGRYSVSTLVPPPIHSITFSPDGRFFAVAAEKGYEIWKTWPLGLVRRRGQLNNRLLRDVMSPVARSCEYTSAEPIANFVRSAPRKPCSSGDSSPRTITSSPSRRDRTSLCSQ